MFYTQYHSKAARTWASMERVQNSEVDKMIDAARATGDAAAQDKIYKDLQKELIDDGVDAFLETQIVRHAMDECLRAMFRCRCSRSTMRSTSTSGRATDPTKAFVAPDRWALKGGNEKVSWSSCTF